MYSVKVSGYDVLFPHQPYGIQKAYMNRMLDCLKNKKNGLLESPTGTGKTLSVLCAAMAWLEQKHEEEDASIRGSSLCEEPQDFNPLSGEGGLNFATASRPELLLKKPLRSRIIYCSRTHVQLSQAMKELNRTYYNTNPAIILGSRDQLCVHPEVRIMESNAAKTHACRLKVRQKTCQFMDNLESKVEKEFEKMEVTDIEDLTTRGIVHNFCPYYASRQLQQKSDVVFSPYNYLMDPNLRATQSIQLEKSVVIFDEGHNIESICEDTASCRLSSSALALCIQAMDPILEKMRGVEEAKNEEADILEQMDNDSLGELPITEYIFLKDVMCDLEEALDAKAIEVKNVKQNRVSVDWIIDLLDNQLKMKTTDDCQRLFQVLDRISMTFSRSVGTTAKGKSAAFDEFSSFMRVLITGRNAAGDHSFKQKYAVSLPIVDTRDRFKKAVDSKGFYSSAKQTEDHNSWNLDVLCLSPSVAMKQLLDLGVECVIITSGTLSPLDSFQNEMEVPFLVKLENRHVIESNQMLVCALSESVKGITFNSTFKNRENADYYLGLGETIIDFFRIIPDGVLIFFSSYTVLYKTIEIWKRNGMWERMDGLKEVFSEPKDRFTFQDALNKFKSVIESSSTKGSAFFGVSRGKLSEGLDVGNRYCRAVIVVGLPYPSCMDARSVLKREYIESKRDPNFTGQIYYEIQMKRSLNQAIGRVIRHKDDYGVVLLLDERFKNHRNSLSKWLQPYFVAKNYRDTRADLMTFFGVGRSNYSSLRKESKDKTPEKTKAVTISGVKREFPETPEEDVVQGYVSDSKQSKPSFSKPSPLFPIFKGQKSRSLFQPLVQKEEKTDEKETLEIEEEMISKPKKKLIVPLTSINESNVVYGAGSSCQGEGDKTNKMSLFLKEHSQMFKDLLKGTNGLQTLVKLLKKYKQNKNGDDSKTAKELEDVVEELTILFSGLPSDKRMFCAEGISAFLKPNHQKMFLSSLTSSL